MTPQAALDRRGLDPFWVATHRWQAQRSLNEADRYAFKAELAFETAALHAADFDYEWFEQELNWAFEYLAVARRYRIDARRQALLAVRAVELERWPAARAELGRVRRGEQRYFGVWPDVPSL